MSQPEISELPHPLELQEQACEALEKTVECFMKEWDYSRKEACVSILTQLICTLQASLPHDEQEEFEIELRNSIG